jgi:hypothetical protein
MLGSLIARRANSRRVCNLEAQCLRPAAYSSGHIMSNAPNQKGPNTKKKQKCKNCEGKGLLKKGDAVVKCQRCKGTGLR